MFESEKEVSPGNTDSRQVPDCPPASRVITVEKVATANLPTETGNFRIAGYRSLTSDEEFVVLIKGEMRADVPTLVRIHSQCLTGDVFGSERCDRGGHVLQVLLDLTGGDDDDVFVVRCRLILRGGGRKSEKR